ncbi:glycosyltransferase family 4 protein [bacterium]|nr:glycosyltransferase family 4 protein [bacterium]
MSNAAPTRSLRILILATGRMVSPIYGGELRVHHLAAELARLGHTVELHSWLSRNHGTNSLVRDRLSITEHHSLRLDLALALDKLRLVPACELPVFFVGLAPSLANLIEAGQFDLIHFELPWFSRALESIPIKPAVIYGAQNVESTWWAPRIERFPFSTAFKRRLLDAELRALKGSDGVVACSDIDAGWMAANAGIKPPRLAVVPNGFDANRFQPPDASSRARLRRKFYFNDNIKIAVFIGAAVEPNREAAELIINKIAPATANEPIHYVIAGRVTKLIAPPTQPNVRLIESLPDVLELLQAADVAINPMLSGSGSNIKLAEALGAGLPVVTTPFGMRGFESVAPWLHIGDIGNFTALIRTASYPSAIPREKLDTLTWTHAARILSAHYESMVAGAHE